MDSIINLKAELTHLIDLYGLKVVMEQLYKVADESAVVIAEDWQDVALAKIWDQRAKILMDACIAMGTDFR